VDGVSTSRPRGAGRAGRVAAAGAVCVMLLASVLWWQIRPVSRVDARPRTVVIPQGATARTIGALLADAGVARRAWAVVLVARALGVAERLRHGEYALRPDQSTPEIVRLLARGETVRHRVTIPEGSTVAQVADLLAAEGLVDRDRFLALALREGRRIGRPILADLPIDSVEGYLFPDTYDFTRGLDEAAVLGRFLDHLDAKLDPALRTAAAARGWSLHDLLTVASMIEREAQVPDERPVVAGVIVNRLARGMRLEIDATVLYALGSHKAALALRDLDVDSPYNTYRRAGLPPGPIANPGLAAITAAAHPAEVPYLYYVLRPDGRHHFSRTYEEHLRAVRRYRP
jgi:UPF0755 protein